MIRIPIIKYDEPTERKTTIDDYLTDIFPVEGYEIENLGATSYPDYDIYALNGIKNNGKPIIYIQAGIHGAEWTSIHAVSIFLEMLNNPPKEHQKIFTDIRNTFNFYAVPNINYWGYLADTYHNSNDVNLSTDWRDKTQIETRTLFSKITELKPYAFIDCHTMIKTRIDYNCMQVGDWDDSEWIRDANNSLSLSSGWHVQYHDPTVLSGPPLPGHPSITYSIVSKEDSYYGGKIKASITEVTANGTPTERVEIGLNMILTQLIYYMHRFRYNKIIL